MMRKSLLLLFLGVGALTKAAENPQVVLYQGIKRNNSQQVFTALTTLKAQPTFVISIQGTRGPKMKKQINALNFALHVFHDKGDIPYEEREDDEDDAVGLLKAILNPLTVKDLEGILRYEDQIEHETPEDLVKTFFPGTDAKEWLGHYVTRRHGPIDGGIGSGYYF